MTWLPFVRPSVVDRRSPFIKIFFSVSAWPIKAKFHVVPPWEGGTKVCDNDSSRARDKHGHHAHTYGITLKSSSPELESR